MERVAPRDPPRLQAFELKRCAPGEDGEDHLEARPALGATIEPDRVRGLHLSGVLDDRRPPERRVRRSRRRGEGRPWVNEDKRPSLLELVEPRREPFEVEERGCSDACTGEALDARARCEWDEPVGGRGELDDSAVVGVRELVPLLLREDAEPERRRERDDRELDLAAVEEGESRLEPVRIEIDLDRGLAGELERRGREPWRASPRRWTGSGCR